MGTRVGGRVVPVGGKLEGMIDGVGCSSICWLVHAVDNKIIMINNPAIDNFRKVDFDSTVPLF